MQEIRSVMPRAGPPTSNAVREAHQTEVAEDYVELIGDLIEQTGEARVVDLASRLGVTNATVNGTIQRLVRDGLVTSEPYRSIFLTSDGAKLAATVRERHETVRDFLIALGRRCQDGGCRRGRHRAPCQQGNADRLSQISS